MYGFNHRQHSSIIKMKQMIDSNKFGNILWARGRYGKSVSKDFMKTGDRILLILVEEY